MYRILALGAAWLAAASLAVLVAWQGVGLIGDQVTEDRPAALSAASIEQQLDQPVQDLATTTVPSSAPVTTQPGQASVTTASTAPGATTTAVRPGTTAGAPATSRPAAAPAGETTRTYNTTGGTVALRFTPAGATVLWARPNAGFESSVEPEHGNGVQVEFRGRDHRSRVAGWWEGGPQDRVREDADNSGEN